MQQVSSSGEAASGTWRRPMTLHSTDPWSIELADDNPYTVDAMHGQMQTSLTSLAEDPYWQQKRDERKGSKQHKGVTGVPSLPEPAPRASTATSERTVLSQAYQLQRISSAKASADDARSQHAFGEGSIPALRMPSRASGQDALLWSGDGRMQMNLEAYDAGSLTRHSRQGSTVRFAVEEALKSSGPMHSVAVPEVGFDAKIRGRLSIYLLSLTEQNTYS